MDKIRNEILNLLKAKKIPFKHLVHKESSYHQVAKELGVKIQEGIKCLILRGKKSNKNYLICILGHQKVDMNVVSDILGESCELEKPEKIKELFGLEVGGIPPFGPILGIDAYFDENILNCREVIFSCGLPQESIKMQLIDLLTVIHPQFATIAR